jgi:hypothetical protein
MSERAADVTTEQGASPAREDAMDEQETMPVLTLYQPWASLVALRRKRIETRSWATKYRGRIAIHAAASVPSAILPLSIGGYEVEKDNPRGTRPAYLLRNETLSWPYRLPLGAIVATADLVDVVPIVEDRPSFVDTPTGNLGVRAVGEYVVLHHCNGFHLIDEPLNREAALGNYDPGRFAWLLSNIEPIEPVPFRGGQALSRKVARDVVAH